MAIMASRKNLMPLPMADETINVKSGKPRNPAVIVNIL
jgi:hypothetical protein